jgi:uncharacterized protein
MHVDIRIFKLFIPHSNSLKAKRQVVRSATERIKSRWNASVVELSGNDVWQRADIGVAILSNDAKYPEEAMAEIERMLAMNSDALLTEVERKS